MLVISSVREAEKFVDRQKRLGNDVRWDNYDIVFFRSDPRGIYDTEDGAFRNGSYGFENRFTVNADGTWRIDYRNVRRSKRSRN